jgi:anti-sigma regulatory factor (Ser/Thr protein kinase)
MVPGSHQHAVSFYDHDRELVDLLARFVADGLALGERVVVVATAPHRLALDDALDSLGVNPDRARKTGYYVALDAGAMLETFLRGGLPDPDLFVRHVGNIVSHAAADGTPVRVFGEMVALLWAEHNVTAVMRLEELWNAYAEQADFSLLCAYPTAGLNGARLADVRSICAVHSALQPPSSYSDGDPFGDGVSGHFSQVFIPVPEAVPAVRRFVAGVLQLWREEAMTADAELVASELATNAVLHADSPFRVSVDRSIGVVCIAIQDAVEGLAEQQPPSRDEMTGRGMAIVNALSRRWGCDALPAGKVVWAELAANRGPLARSATLSA